MILPPHLVKYLAKTFGAWYVVLEILGTSLDHIKDDKHTELAKSEGNQEPMLESAWRTTQWVDQKDALKEQIAHLPEVPTPRRRVFEASIALLKLPATLDKNIEFTKILEDATMQLSLRKWVALPPQLSAAHVPLLQHFQQFVDLQEAVQIFGSLSTTTAQNSEEKVEVLPTTPRRLVIADTTRPPGSSIDLPTLRANMTCSTPASPFLKLREQARCHYQKPNDLQAGLEVINNTNFVFFSVAQKTEFYTLKGIFHARFKRNEEANNAFSQAVQLDMTQAKAWAAWGRFNDNMFKKVPNDLSYAANATSSSALVFQLRTTREEMMQRKAALAHTQAADPSQQPDAPVAANTDRPMPTASDESQQSAPGNTTHGAAEGGAYPRQAWDYVEEVVQLLKTVFPLLVLSLETIVDQVAGKFKSSSEEDTYRHLCTTAQFLIKILQERIT
ncbi:hypothetical protein DFH06DRAFT_1152848 [Mycena polygramma]|nr:hypothetical protein DFH06DRAFT_1152848 [Mycena polygramma]